MSRQQIVRSLRPQTTSTKKAGLCENARPNQMFLAEEVTNGLHGGK